MAAERRAQHTHGPRRNDGPPNRSRGIRVSMESGGGLPGRDQITRGTRTCPGCAGLADVRRIAGNRECVMEDAHWRGCDHHRPSPPFGASPDGVPPGGWRRVRNRVPARLPTRATMSGRWAHASIRRHTFALIQASYRQGAGLSRIRPWGEQNNGLDMCRACPALRFAPHKATAVSELVTGMCAPEMRWPFWTPPWVVHPRRRIDRGQTTLAGGRRTPRGVRRTNTRFPAK
jgi:hypothetical protein